MVVPSYKYVTILKPGVANPADLPETRIASLLRYSPEEQHRVRVRGTLTLVDAGGAAFIEDSTAGIRVGATLPANLQAGDEGEAAGLAVPGALSPILQHAAVRRLGPPTPLCSPDATAEDAIAGTCDSQLVRMEATLVDHVATLADQRLVVQAGDLLFPPPLPDERQTKDRP